MIPGHEAFADEFIDRLARETRIYLSISPGASIDLADWLSLLRLATDVDLSGDPDAFINISLLNEVERLRNVTIRVNFSQFPRLPGLARVDSLETVSVATLNLLITSPITHLALDAGAKPTRVYDSASLRRLDIQARGAEMNFRWLNDIDSLEELSVTNASTFSLRGTESKHTCRWSTSGGA